MSAGDDGIRPCFYKLFDISQTLEVNKTSTSDQYVWNYQQLIEVDEDDYDTKKVDIC